MANDNQLGGGPHLLDDMPPWMDLSTWLAFQLEGVTPEMIAADTFDHPKDRALILLRVNAIRERQEWEATHPHGPPFKGVFLTSSQVSNPRS